MSELEEPLYPVSVLIKDFGNEDIELRLNSVRHLSTIARALGEERTRKELIPFLSENNDNGDQVLLAMAEELGVFIPYVGGVEYAHVLLPPLETLCTEEDTCVRDKAVESLCRIGAQMKQSHLEDWFIPLVQRLAASEWYTARGSSCGLFHIAYPSAPYTLNTELRSIYSQLCQDDMPIVRRSAASNLGKFAATVEASHLKTDFIPIFEDLAMDGLDSVRLLAVEGCAALGKLLEPQDCVAYILPVIVNFSQDKSWRIRRMVANQLYDLCEVVGPESTRTDLFPAYVRLLRDNEAEVRIAAAGKITKFCRILNPRLAVQHILPCVKELSADSSEHVRSALASAIMGMAPVLGKDATIEQLLPIFLSLLKDEFPDVRLNIISKLDQVNQIPKEDVEPHIPKEDEEPEKQYSEIKKNHSHQQSNARSESIENYLTIELERNTHKRFSHEELMKFTSGFAVKVGRGGFGSVYRGKFLNGTEIVVKVLKENDFVEETFLAEVSTMFKTCHRYLVKCYGYCFDPTMKALVYEYMENGSLDALLYGNPRKLEWKTFYKIAIKTAKGLSYLHDGCDNQIIHHDLKPANVLIDKHLCVKITDFGVARIMINNADHVTWTKLRGTTGYIAPEMIMPDSKITCKCDVYSFGMMLFEVLGMRSNGGGLDWFPRKVWSKFESGELDQIIDDCGIHKEKYRVRARVVSKVALWCAQHTPQARPSMSTVVKMLEEEIPVTEPPNPFYPAPEWSYSKFYPSPFLDKKSK